MTLIRLLLAVLCAFSLATCASNPGAQQPRLSPSQDRKERPVDRAGRRLKSLQMPDVDDTIRKISHGVVAPPGKFPFQVAIIRSDTPPDMEYFGQFCGGTLIAPNWVLTAAHCVPRTEAKEVDLYIGAQNLPREAPASGSRVHAARVISQNYDAKTYDNDIALIKLANPTNDLKPAGFATADIAKDFGGTGKKLTVIGWGRTGPSEHGSSELREVEVTVQDSGTCQKNYQADPAAKNTVITGNMFCAGEPQGGKDSCGGDSGGFIGAEVNKVWVGMGIVSFGANQCGEPGLFGIYTRVANYVDWITKTMKAN